jgi:hypothetical protein
MIDCRRTILGLLICLGPLMAVEQPDPLLPVDPPPAKPADAPAKPANAPAAPANLVPPPPAVIAAPKAPPRLAVPDEAAQAEALKGMKDLFKEEFSKRRSDDRLALARMLLIRGQQAKLDPAQRFVVLREAGDIAAKHGDVETALASAEEINLQYAVPQREETARVLSAMASNLSDPNSAQTAAFATLSLIESCIAADDYGVAMRLSKDGENISRRLRDPALVSRSKALGERAKMLDEEFRKLGELHDLLGELSSEGHRRLGQFLCLYKGEWLTGLLHLVAGDDAALATLARCDLAAHVMQDKAGNDGSAALAAAEAWNAKASDLPRGIQRESAQTRSLLWYRRASALLVGAPKAKAEKRVIELERSLGSAVQGSLALYPPGPALLLTFEADTLQLAGSRVTGVLDGSGSGLRFPVTGAVPHRGGHGIAMQFDGSGQIDAGNPKHLQITGNLTIAFWLWADSLAGRSNPLNKSYGGEYTFTLEPSGAVNYFYGTPGSDSSPYTAAGMNIAITAKTWVHLAVVRDFTSKSVTWYRNGKPTTSVVTAYPAAGASQQPLLIGNGYANPFKGQLDDIGIWPRALSAQEIAALCAATSAGR